MSAFKRRSSVCIGGRNHGTLAYHFLGKPAGHLVRGQTRVTYTRSQCNCYAMIRWDLVVDAVCDRRDLKIDQKSNFSSYEQGNL